jgi:hypothetical protein
MIHAVAAHPWLLIAAAALLLAVAAAGLVYAWLTRPGRIILADRTGADEQYGADLRTINTLLQITGNQPEVDPTDADRSAERVHRHVDDNLVELSGGDQAVLATCRATAARTGEMDMATVRALLAAEDELAAIEAREAESIALLIQLMAEADARIKQWLGTHDLVGAGAQ